MTWNISSNFNNFKLFHLLCIRLKKKKVKEIVAKWERWRKEYWNGRRRRRRRRRRIRIICTEHWTNNSTLYHWCISNHFSIRTHCAFEPIESKEKLNYPTKCAIGDGKTFSTFFSIKNEFSKSNLHLLCLVFFH